MSNEYECKKCGKGPFGEELYVYKNGKFYEVMSDDEIHYFIATTRWEIDKRFKELDWNEIYPKYLNENTFFNGEATETAWLEEHLCECGNKFSFHNSNY